MSLAEREVQIQNWATRVHEAEKAIWHQEFEHRILRRPAWSLAHWDNYIDARQLWPYSTAAKHYHRAFDLGIRTTDMAEIARATYDGSESDLLCAIESGVPVDYMLVLNQAYRERLKEDGISPGPYPVLFLRRLHDSNVPADYAAVLIRHSAPVPSCIIEVYEQGIPAELAVELDLENLAVTNGTQAGGPFDMVE